MPEREQVKSGHFPTAPAAKSSRIRMFPGENLLWCVKDREQSDVSAVCFM